MFLDGMKHCAGGTRRHQRHAASRADQLDGNRWRLAPTATPCLFPRGLRPLTRLTTFLNSGTARPAACRIQAEPCLLVSLSPTVLAVTLLVHRASKQMAGRNGSQTQR